MSITCKNENKLRLLLFSPVKMQFSLNCQQKEIKVNDLKKIRSLITSVSSEVTNDIYESSGEKMHIFDIFFIDVDGLHSNVQGFSDQIQKQIIKISKILNWPSKKLRINFQVYFPVHEFLKYFSFSSFPREISHFWS